MLTDQEWAELEPLMNRVILDIKNYRTEFNCSLEEAYRANFGENALKAYGVITGYNERNLNALWHHRVSLYGPPCQKCGKPLRTPKAAYCAECGAVRIKENET
jgi:hypothetical protein